MLMLGEISRFACLGQMDENYAFLRFAAHAEKKPLAFQRGQHFIHLAFEQARLSDERRCGTVAARVLRAEQNAEHVRFVVG